MAINVYLNDRDEVLNVHLNESGAKGEKGDPIKIVETTVDNQGNTVIKFNDGSTTTIKKGERGEKGDKGDGITVLGTEKNTNGDLVVKFSDGSKVTVPKGEKGEQGEVGKTGATGEGAKITSQRKLESGDTELSFNDGTKVVIPKGEKGDKGLKGDTGAKGDKGSTGEASKILSTEYDNEGNTVIKFNDGNSVTVKKGEKGEKGATGEQGKQGEKGDTGEPLKVLSTSTDNSGNTVIKFSDNSIVTVKKGDKGDKGEQGEKGDVGESAKIVTETKDENGNTLITFNDGKTVTIKKGDKGDVGAKGEQGTKGDKGLKGDKGDSITVESSSLDGNGNTIIKFSDGKSITVRKGDKGEQGIKGEKGEPFKYEDFTKEQIDSLKASFNVKEVTSLTGTGDVTTLYVYEGGLYFWNGTEYKKAVDLSKKVDTSSITSDENASGADKIFSVDFIKAKLKEMGVKIDKKVSEEQGKGLSTNDFTTDYKNKLNNLSSTESGNEATTSNRGYMSAADKKKLDGIDLSKYAEAGWVDTFGREIIDILREMDEKADKTDIKTNLSDFADDETHRTVTDTEKAAWSNKAEKTDIPTKLSQLENDKTFKTETEIKALIKTEAPKQDLSGYAKTEDLKDYAKKTDIRPEAKFKTMTAVIDQSNSNPLTCITYEDDAKFMEKGSADWDDFFGAKLVLFKGGKEVRDLKDEELNSLTEADGDVMVKFKRMGLNIKTVGDKVYVSMTDNTDSEDFKYYAHTRGAERREAFYLGAYLGYEKDGKLRSIKGFEPTGNKTIGDFRTIAQANGAGYEQLAFYQWTFLQAMYVLKYGSLDSQTALGKGLTNGSNYLSTGGTNGKGVDFGNASGTDQMRFQYIEDMWGNKPQWLDGIKSVENSQMKTGTDKFSNDGADYSAYNLGFSGNVYNYVKNVQGTSELGFVIKANGGSTSTYYCDYQDVFGDREKFGCVGGSRGYGASAGAFCFYCSFSASGAYSYVGGRLMFL